jgi:hypothetical protein
VRAAWWKEIPVTSDGWALPPEPAHWGVTIPTDDASIARRRRALAPIQVLTDIERTKGSLDGDFWHRYDLFNIALAVIDQVALAMGISAGRTWEEALEYAAGQARRQVPDAPTDQCNAIAERVLVSLVTTDVETVPYLVHTADGPAWRAQRFRLLYAHATPDGGEHLRASEQAINIFVDALDLDIEAAQIANEAQLNALVARGAIGSAVQIARHARYRSIQFQERIRRIIADTLVDPDTHDWIGDVPTLLDGALVHVRERLTAETVLLDAVADRRGELDDEASISNANQLVELLRECRHRHDELHSHLIGARARLRGALDDRFTRPPRTVHRYDIGSDLLVPFMTRPTRQAAAVAERMVATVGGLSARWWPALEVITAELCAAIREPKPGDEVVPPEFDGADQPEWWEPYEETTDAIFDAIDEPVLLSQLLARVGEIAGNVTDADGEPLDADTLAATVVHAAHRAWATRLAGRSADERLVLGVDLGGEFDTGDIRSRDLLLVPGTAEADIQEDTRTRAHPAGLADPSSLPAMRAGGPVDGPVDGAIDGPMEDGPVETVALRTPEWERVG